MSRWEKAVRKRRLLGWHRAHAWLMYLYRSLLWSNVLILVVGAGQFFFFTSKSSVLTQSFVYWVLMKITQKLQLWPPIKWCFQKHTIITEICTVGGKINNDIIISCNCEFIWGLEKARWCQIWVGRGLAKKVIKPVYVCPFAKLILRNQGW